MATTFDFNPDRIAYCETNSWRAYYDRDWLTLLRLVVTLCQEQFRIPFPISILASFYTARASAAWASGSENEPRVLKDLEKFYVIAKRHSGLDFDPAEVAKLETRYWEVHRRLSGKPDKTEFIQTMTDLHSAVFGLSPEQARESAELRVLANNTVDLITSHASTDPETDWHKLEEYLQGCYRSIHRELNAVAVR
jgi:hypothetical protein